MQKPLRSNLEPGSPREAVRRAQWKALGLSDEDLLKPKIAVVNSSSELAICFSHLDGIAKIVKEAVRDAGGLPFEIRTAAPSDFIISAGAGRRLHAREPRSHRERHGDRRRGRAARRHDLPVVVRQDAAGASDGGRAFQHSDDSRDLRLPAERRLPRQARRHRGRVPRARCRHRTASCRRTAARHVRSRHRGPGVCAGMATANSMHIVCEALGMALPGSAPVLANSPKMIDNARRSGRRIVEMVLRRSQAARHPHRPARFDNAAAAVLAVSGSINCIKHLQATAIEAGVDVDVFQLFNELGDEGSGTERRAPQRRHDRGVRGGRRCARAAEAARAAARSERAHGDGPTGSRESRRCSGTRRGVIRPLERPVLRRAADHVLHGSLAPESAIVKLGLRGAGPQDALHGSGRGLRRTGRGHAAQSRSDRGQRGHVLVVRGMGPKGGPGMAGPASSVVFALDAAGLQNEVAFVSDGQLSGLCNKGLTVAEVSPEAAVGGPLALVENGDRIRIDVDAHLLDLEVRPEELAARRLRRGRAGCQNRQGIFPSTGAACSPCRPARCWSKSTPPRGRST